MNLNSLRYQVLQGIKNIVRNKMFSFASIATMTASIFIFGIFFAIILNINSVIRDLEERVGITVFFEEGMSEEDILEVGKSIVELPYVTDARYTSAEEAWENYKKEYFGDDPSLADGFKGDNPLADSASFTVTVDRVENQTETVNAILAMDGVRRVNHSSAAIRKLEQLNQLLTYVSIAVIAVLLIVAVILISNTISMGIAVRKEEISIMKLIGATDAFVRAPFVVEGLVLGLIGSAIPLFVLWAAYDILIGGAMKRFGILGVMKGMLLETSGVFSYLVPVGFILGVGIGLFGAIITVRKHLAV